MYTFTEEDLAFIYFDLIISSLGIICNIGVICIIVCNKKPGSMFLVNLSCSDLCFSLSVCIVFVINIYNGEWSYITCDISGVMSALCGCQILLSLALISIERYLVIVHPLSTLWKTNNDTNIRELDIFRIYITMSPIWMEYNSGSTL